MGYEIKMLVGKQCLNGKELVLNKEKPFSDGSGFPYKRDGKGNYVETGRAEAWFQIYAEIDLCKWGYQKDAFNDLVTKSHDEKRAKKEVIYFYGTDGNTRITEDCYGAQMFPVPIKDALKALKASEDKSAPYRRATWAIALLESMVGDPEELGVMFYGH